MKSQVGRCTAVYESKRFPYFTINKPVPHVTEGPFGGIQAFFERLAFVKKYSLALQLMDVEVDTDCEFHVQDEDAVGALAHFIFIEYEIELLVLWDPRVTPWDFIPFDWREHPKGCPSNLLDEGYDEAL